MITARLSIRSVTWGLGLSLVLTKTLPDTPYPVAPAQTLSLTCFCTLSPSILSVSRSPSLPNIYLKIYLFHLNQFLFYLLNLLSYQIALCPHLTVHIIYPSQYRYCYLSYWGSVDFSWCSMEWCLIQLGHKGNRHYSRRQKFVNTLLAWYAQYDIGNSAILFIFSIPYIYFFLSTY